MVRVNTQWAQVGRAVDLLNMTRSMGDLLFKAAGGKSLDEQAIIPNPQVFHVTLGSPVRNDYEKKCGIVLVSDGITKEWRNTQILDNLKEYDANMKKFICCWRKYCIAKGSLYADNATAIVLKLSFAKVYPE